MTAISTQAHICPEKKKKLGVGQIILIIVMMLFVLICTLPFINVIAMSMSSKSAILRGAVSFWPVEFNVDAYKLIVSDNSMWHSLLYTIELTVIYTVLAMVMTILVAFPLSMRRLKGQRVIMFFIVFTMYFSGGTIPIYLNVKEFGMLDSMWSLIIPGLISTFNVIILKNFFSSLPYELVEAASIDGATDFQVLTRFPCFTQSANGTASTMRCTTSPRVTSSPCSSSCTTSSRAASRWKSPSRRAARMT